MEYLGNSNVQANWDMRRSGKPRRKAQGKKRYTCATAESRWFAAQRRKAERAESRRFRRLAG